MNKLLTFLLFSLATVPLVASPAYAQQSWYDVGIVKSGTSGKLCRSGGDNDLYCDTLNPSIAATGAVGISDTTPDLDLTLDVEGKVGMMELCDENGLNCTTPVAINALVASAVSSIDDLTDAKHDTDDYSSLFIGNGAGAVDDGTTNQNVGVGSGVLNANINGSHNTGIGYNVLFNTTGDSNTAVGRYTLNTNTTGNYNTGIGSTVLFSNTIGDNNIGLGISSLSANTIGNYNVGVGSNANYYNQAGSNNTILGHNAGMGTVLHNKSGNIFLGYNAGFNEGGDNKLYIENSDSATPLIGGDFAADTLTFAANTVTVSGTVVADSVSATTFVGDGSGLTGVSGLWSDQTTHISNTGIVYIGDSIGIGETAPTASLTIVTNNTLNKVIDFPRSDGSGGYKILANSAWPATFEIHDSYDNTAIQIESYSANSTYMRFRHGSRDVSFDQKGAGLFVIGKYGTTPSEADPVRLNFSSIDTGNNLGYIRSWKSGTSGILKLSAWGGGSSEIYIDGETDGVGIGTISPSSTLHVSGTTTSDFFVGDGSGLTGVVATMGIDDLTDAKHDTDDYSSLFIGNGAGAVDDGTDNRNIGVGNSALYSNTSGRENTATGRESMYSNTTGVENVAYGHRTLYASTTGSYNTAVGFMGLRFNVSGNRNTGVGHSSLYMNTEGTRNTGIGYQANFNNETGSNNTIIGYEAGKGSIAHDKSGNIFLGYQAGFNEGGDNKLYIENSDSATPLIGGDFAADELYFNATVGVGTSSPSQTVDVAGTMRAADTVGACGADNVGAIRYNSSTQMMEICYLD